MVCSSFPHDLSKPSPTIKGSLKLVGPIAGFFLTMGIISASDSIRLVGNLEIIHTNGVVVMSALHAA